MSNISAYALPVVFFQLLFLVGCGGGGGGGTTGPVTSTDSFPLQSAVKASIASGGLVNYIVSGTCSGTATSSDSTPVSATFEGVVGLSVTSSVTINLTNCTPTSSAVTGIGYYDTNYNPLGHSIPGDEYGVYLLGTTPLPTSVKVGDTGIIGTETIYSNSLKSVWLETEYDNYLIEPDTASTAIVNLITRTYDTLGRLTVTSQARYRITKTGVLTPLYDDIQYSTTSNNHFIFTAI